MPKRTTKNCARKKLAIAFRAYKEGIYKHEYKGRRANVLWNTRVKDSDEKEIFIKRKEIKTYLDEYFWSALNIYYITENMQTLPFSGGWAEQPYEIVTVISLLRVEQSKWDKEELDKKLKK